eukprot:TRINITY_DN26953_c0_g2_i1.p1 TRINITY_DN26953_c0_g2~~TRINITY_DN26953_c0_g2_i1.p1  ORF type:complete len:503 (-),score=53.73 TRINITY_DN26953_c0_g2_i1:169-1677(-)
MGCGGSSASGQRRSRLDRSIKSCPACGIYIERLGEDECVMCGCESRQAGASMAKALQNGGCGHEFRWRTLDPVGNGSPGAPANERQVRFYSRSIRVSRNRETMDIADSVLPGFVDEPGESMRDNDKLELRSCPACGIYIENIDGGEAMMCGCESRRSGGTYEKAIAGGGCGHEFNWNTLEPIGCGEFGQPANERQVNFIAPENTPKLQNKFRAVATKELTKFDELLRDTYVAKATQDRPCPSQVCLRRPGGCSCVQTYPAHVFDELPLFIPGLPVGYRVSHVMSIEDTKLWELYLRKKESILEKRKGILAPMKRPPMTTRVVQKYPELFGQLDVDCNEAYLLHGTDLKSAMSIAQDHFDVNLAGTAGTGSSTTIRNQGMYGSGIYFAESSTKADEYSKKLEEGGPNNDTFAMLVCRVLLGQYHYTQHKDVDAEGFARSGLSDSTLGDRLSSVGTFREFVVYSSAQVYPQYLLIYQRVHFRDTPAQVEQRLKDAMQFQFTVHG